MIRSLPDLNGYQTPFRGHPMLHQEIGWFATDDDRALGILIRDKVERDFSWVVLEKVEGVYRCTDMAASQPTREAAEIDLKKAMARGAGSLQETRQ